MLARVSSGCRGSASSISRRLPRPAAARLHAAERLVAALGRRLRLEGGRGHRLPLGDGVLRVLAVDRRAQQSHDLERQEGARAEPAARRDPADDVQQAIGPGAGRGPAGRGGRRPGREHPPEDEGHALLEHGVHRRGPPSGRGPPLVGPRKGRHRPGSRARVRAGPGLGRPSHPSVGSPRSPRRPSATAATAPATRR